MTLAGDVVTVPVKTKADVNIAEELGTKFFVRVEYNNSVAILDWTAQPADGDKQAGVVVYNQRPKGIANEALKGQTFDVTQTMTSDGTSTISIKGTDVEYTGENAINQFAELINGEDKTVITDVYDRAFKYDYTISSSNSKIVIADNSEKKITFGTGTENGIIVTITAGSVSYSFTLNVSTTGVIRIEVEGAEQNLANPKYSLDGKAGNEVVLKNTSEDDDARNGLLDVYVTSGKYDPNYYTIRLKDESSAALNGMIQFTTGETTTEIKSFKIKENFADDVTISFVATNSDSTLNFTFDITIKKYATEEKVDFANIKYGEYVENGETKNQTAVADEDKGEDFDPTAIYVYAAFPIDLDEYVKVRLGEADAEGNTTYVNWANIYGEGLLSVNGDDVGIFENGKLTFNDVYEPTQYTFTLYVQDGNKYAYYKDLTLIVCPNFKLVQKSKDLSVKEIKLDNKFEDYFELVRTTLGYGTVQAVDAKEIGGISSYEISKYYQLDTNKQFVSVLPLDLGYGETYKTITISAKATIKELEKVVATCSANLSLGFSIVDLANFSDLFMAGTTIKYNGYDAVWVDGESASFVKDYKDIDSEIGIKLNPVRNAYNIAATSINFTSTSNDALVAGNSVYFQVYFTDGDNTLATWRIPFVWSRVGSKIASYPYETPSDSNTNNTDLNDTLNNPNNLFAEVEGGKTYYLVAPFEYYLEGGILTIVEKIGDGNGDGNDDGNITYTPGENGETFTFEGVSFTVNENNEIVNNGKAISVGQTFTITNVAGVTTTYYFKSIDTTSKAIVIYKAYVGSKNENGCKINYNGGEKQYTYKDSIYGEMLTSLGDNKYLTGLQQTDFASGTRYVFEVLNNQKVYSITNNKLTINNIISENYVDAFFYIVQSTEKTGVENLRYKFTLKVKPNATNYDGETNINVTYPFGGSAENLTVENSAEKEIDLKAELGADTQNQGKHRIADIIKVNGENVDISANATLTVSQLLIDGKDYTKKGNDDKYYQTNEKFTVAIQIIEKEIENENKDKVKIQTNLNVTFTNKANAKNVTVKLLREYPNVYGADFEYVFSINASSVEYVMAYNNQQGGGEFTMGTRDATWKLANTTDAQTVKATTKQRTDSGESNVDPNKVVTVLTHNLGDGYEVEYDYKAANPTLSIKLPEFRESEITRNVYFSVDGKVISTITLIIPATVNASQKNQTLSAGGKYAIDRLVELTTENAELDTIKIEDGDTDYVSLAADGKSIQIFNAIEDKTIKLKLSYTYGENNTGFVIYTYEIAANIKPKQSLETQSIIAGKEYTGITFASLQQDTTISSDGFEPTWSAQDSGLFDTITMSGDGQITIIAKDVAITTSTTVTLTLTYNNEEKDLFTFNVSVPVTIYPAYRLKTNYPNPSQTENLTYESVKSGIEIEKFLESAAEFASANRIQAAAAIADSNGGYDDGYAENYSALSQDASVKIKIIEQQNMSAVMCGGSALSTNAETEAGVESAFTFKKGDGTGTSYVILQVKYHGVSINYTVYVFDNVVSGYVNSTIHRNGEVETIYQDRIATTDLFNKSRLLKLEVGASALVGAVYYPYVVEVDANGTYTPVMKQGTSEPLVLLQFQLKSEYVGRTIYVDSGVSALQLAANQTIVFFAKADADVTKEAVMTGVTFVRTAGRVEYRYATADGQSIDITNANMYTAATTANPDGDNIYKVGYYIGKTKPTESKDFKSQISYQVKMGLDVAVDRSFTPTDSSSTPTVIEIEAHKGEYYRLVEQAGIRHPSTGELITAKSLGDAELQYEVIKVSSNSSMDRIFDGYKHYQYQNSKNEDYLKLHDIAEQVGKNDSKKIYDYYLFGLGCAADGDYVLVKIIYQYQKETLPFYIVVKIVPDYEITLAGEKYEPVVENNSAYVTNKDKPYVFTPSVTDGKSKEMTLAGKDAGEQLISAIRTNWNSTNIAYSFAYVLEKQENSEYNTQANIDKLQLTTANRWSEVKDENDVGTGAYKPNSNSTTIKFAPAEVVFGVKQYFVEITDDYGYKIMFYFNLVPADDQTPTVYEAVSTLNFTEGDDFDIGLVYDAISINDDEKNVTKSAEIEYNKAPETDTIKKIILQNIDAWGLTTNYTKPTDKTNNFDDITGMADKYKNAPKFHDVTVTGVTFKYESDKGTSAGSVTTGGYKTFKLGDDGSTVKVGSYYSYAGVNYLTQYNGTKVSLSTTLTGTITGTTTGEGESAKPTYTWKTPNINNNNVAQMVNDKIKIQVGESLYGEGDTIKIDVNSKTYTTYFVDKIEYNDSTKKGTVVLKATYETQGDGNRNTDGALVYDYYLGFNTDGTKGAVGDATDAKGSILATDALYWPSKNDQYRTLSAGYYKVPYMDGWIYGTSDTTQVSILISLTYKKGDTNNEESCVVVYNANITKKAKFNSTAKVIVDGVPFTLKYTEAKEENGEKIPASGYIQVADGLNNDNGTTNPIYDDTIAVTIPAQGQVVLSVSICEDRTKLTSWKNYMLTRNNTSTTSQRTDFISISEIYGKTIDFKTGVCVSWAGPDGSSVYYATQPVASPTGSITIEKTTYNYKILKLQDGTETKYKLAMIKEDNENSAWRMVDNYSGSKVVLNDKTYEVGFDIKAAIPAGVNQQAQPEKVKLKLGNTLNQKEEYMYPQQTLATYDPITTDTLYIESAERIPSKASVTDVYQYSITKSYIIKANGTYYQYKHNFTMTPKYAYFDNGLGQEVVKELPYGYHSGSDEAGYTITLAQWANGIKFFDKDDSENKNPIKEYGSVTVASAEMNTSTVAQGEFKSLTENDPALEFTIGKDGTSYSDAEIKSNGTIYTGANYKVGNNQYILIRIWIKASGGPDGNFNGEKYGNANYKKLLGELRIYLTNNKTNAKT